MVVPQQYDKSGLCWCIQMQLSAFQSIMLQRNHFRIQVSLTRNKRFNVFIHIIKTKLLKSCYSTLPINGIELIILLSVHFCCPHIIITYEIQVKVIAYVTLYI
jgi:hypothetical protein